MKRKEFRMEDDEFITCNYDKLTNVQIAREIGSNPRSVVSRAKQLGLMQPVIKERYVFSRDEETFIINYYGVLEVQKIAAKLHTTVSSIHRIANKLGNVNNHPQHTGKPYLLFSDISKARLCAMESKEAVIVEHHIRGSYVPCQYEVRFNNHPDFDRKRYDKGEFKDNEVFYRNTKGIIHNNIKYVKN